MKKLNLKKLIKNPKKYLNKKGYSLDEVYDFGEGTDYKFFNKKTLTDFVISVYNDGVKIATLKKTSKDDDFKYIKKIKILKKK